MFERIKNIFNGIGLVVKYGDTIRNVTTVWANYPGISDSEMLRIWVRPLLTDAGSLALLTQTTIDDIIVQAAIKVVDNNRAWDVVHGLALLISEGFDFNTLFIPGVPGDIFDMSRSIANETMPECPAAIISAIGVLLFLVRTRSNNQ